MSDNTTRTKKKSTENDNEIEYYLKWIHGNVVQHAGKDDGRRLLQQTKSTRDIRWTVTQRREKNGHNDRDNDGLEDSVEVKTLLTEGIHK